MAETPEQIQDTSEQTMLQVPNNAKNYMQCHIIGFVAKVVKSGIPREFDYQPDKTRLSNTTGPPDIPQNERIMEIEDCKNEVEEGSELGGSLIGSDLHTDGVTVKEETIDVTEERDPLELETNIAESKSDLFQESIHLEVASRHTEMPALVRLQKQYQHAAAQEVAGTPEEKQIWPRKRAQRAAETPEEKQIRRQKHAEYVAARRAAETPEKTQIRRQQQARYKAMQRAAQTPEEKLIRQQQEARYKAMQRAAQTPEERQLRRQQEARYKAMQRAAQTPEEKQIRRQQEARYKAMQRAAKTSEEEQIRRQTQAEYVAAKRAAETAEETRIRRQKQAEYVAVQRATETVEEKRIRRQKQAECMAAKRAAETPEKARIRRQKHAESVAAKRAAETNEEARIRRQKHAEYLASKRAAHKRLLDERTTGHANGTTDPRQDSDTNDRKTVRKETIYVKEEKPLDLGEDADKRFEKVSYSSQPDPLITKQEDYKVATRGTETPEQARLRLQKHREYLAARRATETPEEYEDRLKKHREYLAAKRTTETPEEYHNRLKKQSEYLAARRAAETPEERQVRLQKHREYLAARRAAETPEETRIRLLRQAQRMARKRGGKGDQTKLQFTNELEDGTTDTGQGFALDDSLSGNSDLYTNTVIVKEEVIDVIEECKPLELVENVDVTQFLNVANIHCNKMQELEVAFHEMSLAMARFKTVDPDTERFSRIDKEVNDVLACYRQMYEEMKFVKTEQPTSDT